MNIVTYFLVGLSLILSGIANASGSEAARPEFSCGTHYVCLTDEELRAFSGKTIQMQHVQPEFGTVTIVFPNSSWVRGQNAKSSASGTWEIREGKIFAKTVEWDTFVLHFFRVDGKLFHRNTRYGYDIFIPVKIVD